MTRLEAIKESLESIVTPEAEWVMPKGKGFQQLAFHESGDQEFVVAAPRNVRWLMERVEELVKAIGPLATAGRTASIPNVKDPEQVFLWSSTSNFGHAASISFADALRARDALAALEEEAPPASEDEPEE